LTIDGDDDPRPFFVIKRENIKLEQVSPEIADAVVIPGVALYSRNFAATHRDSGVRSKSRHAEGAIKSREVRFLKDGSVVVVIATLVMYKHDTALPYFKEALGSSICVLVAVIGTSTTNGIQALPVTKVMTANSNEEDKVVLVSHTALLDAAHEPEGVLKDALAGPELKTRCLQAGVEWFRRGVIDDGNCFTFYDSRYSKRVALQKQVRDKGKKAKKSKAIVVQPKADDNAEEAALVAYVGSSKSTTSTRRASRPSSTSSSTSSTSGRIGQLSYSNFVPITPKPTNPFDENQSRMVQLQLRAEKAELRSEIAAKNFADTMAAREALTKEQKARATAEISAEVAKATVVGRDMMLQLLQQQNQEVRQDALASRAACASQQVLSAAFASGNQDFIMQTSKGTKDEKPTASLSACEHEKIGKELKRKASENNRKADEPENSPDTAEKYRRLAKKQMAESKKHLDIYFNAEEEGLLG
jgi:hypothetical protein